MAGWVLRQFEQRDRDRWPHLRLGRHRQRQRRRRRRVEGHLFELRHVLGGGMQCGAHVQVWYDPGHLQHHRTCWTGAVVLRRRLAHQPPAVEVARAHRDGGRRSWHFHPPGLRHRAAHGIRIWAHRGVVCRRCARANGSRRRFAGLAGHGLLEHAAWQSHRERRVRGQHPFVYGRLGVVPRPIDDVHRALDEFRPQARRRRLHGRHRRLRSRDLAELAQELLRSDARGVGGFKSDGAPGGPLRDYDLRSPGLYPANELRRLALVGHLPRRHVLCGLARGRRCLGSADQASHILDGPHLLLRRRALRDSRT
mmetsp:Transcript_112743/g.323997  ORF Transcript_112743/g.323997 Transcript_112743/m.323997 type:complete len:310 (-) Transcript_112743:790-1719(-)